MPAKLTLSKIPDPQKIPINGYRDNNNIKRDGVVTQFTPQQITEYQKCMQSVDYFAKTYVKIIDVDEGLIDFDVYPYQTQMFDMYNRNRFNVVLACRQSGKTTAVVAYLLWFAMFHSEKTIAVLANKGAMAREILERITLALENLPFWLQCGCKTVNKGSIHFSNNSKMLASSTSANSIRGYSISLLYLDEFAAIENDRQFYTSTYPVITKGKKTKVIITSTANGIGNVFYKIFEGSRQKVNGYHNMVVNWWDVPGRDEKWKQQTIANTSQEEFDQEFGNQFIGSSNTLINADKLLAMVAHKPIAINYDKNLFVYDKPIHGHQYIITVDVSKGRGQDYSAFTVIDITSKPYTQVCVFHDSMISPILFPTMIVKTAHQYNEAIVIVENNDVGQVVCNGIYYDLEYENMFVESMVKRGGVGVTQTKKTKRIGCSNLKDLIETNNLLIKDATTISELSTFCAKGNSYEAQPTCHDDTTMCLVIFSWFVATPAFQDHGDDLKKLLYQDREMQIEDDLLSIGFITSPPPNPTLDYYEQMAEELRNWGKI